MEILKKFFSHSTLVKLIKLLLLKPEHCSRWYSKQQEPLTQQELLVSVNGEATAAGISMSLGAIIKRHKRTLINFQQSFLIPFVKKAALSVHAV